ncbi:MAG: phosphatase PAP2 family protein [Lepagella sp.]
MLQTKRTLTIILAVLRALPVLRAEEPLSTPRRNVRTSTDVLAVAMPAATLTTLLAMGDWQGLKQGVFAAATTVGATYILKYAVHKRRPDGSDDHSFPSMHTATVFADAAFLQRRFGWKVGIPAYALAAYVGWGRTFGRKHDWWDVAAGAAIGAGSAYLYTRPFAREHNLSIMPVTLPDGMGVAASFSF